MSATWVRQRVSQACKLCQAKKIKCGGELPECKTCARQNKKCSYGISRRNTRRNLNRAVSTALASIPTPDDLPSVPTSTNDTVSQPRLIQPTVEFAPISVTTEASVQLFDTYFRHIHPIWPLLYKPVYDPIGYLHLAEYLPKSVSYAIFAIASCLHDQAEPEWSSDAPTVKTPPRHPDVSPNRYFEAAVIELQCGKQGQKDVNMLHALRPSISHCQTLTILALQQHGVAEFARANLFCSLAASMAIDLRLHRCCGPEGSVEREVGSRLWWNIYILEKMLSLEMGRPMAWRFDESDAPFPSTEESDEFELFRPPRQAGMDHRIAVPLQKLQTLTAFHTTIELCRLMERVSTEIYSLGARRMIKLAPGAGDATRMRLWRDVQQWRSKTQGSPFNVDLSRDGATLPVMVTNHVQICSLTILLHRPFMSSWLQHLSMTGQPPFETTSPVEICYKAAEDICRILESYSRYIPQLPCDLIFPIFVAASTVLHQLRNSRMEAADSQERLKLCLSWLSVFSKNWQNAREREKLLYELYDTPGTPLIRSSPSAEDIGKWERQDRGATSSLTPPPPSGAEEHLDYLHSLSNVVTDSPESCPDFNMDFWMFLEEQHMWSN